MVSRNQSSMPFEKVLFGLGIRYVGETVAKKLVAHFKTIDNLMAATAEELTAAEEIGGRIAESITNILQMRTIAGNRKIKGTWPAVCCRRKRSDAGQRETKRAKALLYRACSKNTRAMN
jgi:NAD-dependent DNA ligase